MKKEMTESVFRYTLTMSMVESMHKQGIISDAEYDKIEVKFCEKYCINFASIFRKKRWI